MSEFISSEIYQTEVLAEITEAKEKELNNWRDQEVYDVVKDDGQPCITVRWVITPKTVDGKRTTLCYHHESLY